MSGLLNPKIYFTTPEQTPWDKLQRRKRVATLVLACLLTIGILWLLFFSPVFIVTDVLVRGPATKDMIYQFDAFRGANIFGVNAEKLEQRLQSLYPHIKSITIYRGLPNALKVEIATRKEALIWETGGKRYFVDFEGYPFGEAIGEDQSLAEALENIVEQPASQQYEGLPVVVDTLNAPVTLGTALVSPEFVVFIQTIFTDFEQTIGIAPTAMRVGETTFQIEVVTSEGFSVYFDTTRKPLPQLKALKRILDTNRSQVSEYIDLRVSGKAYIK